MTDDKAALRAERIDEAIKAQDALYEAEVAWQAAVYARQDAILACRFAGVLDAELMDALAVTRAVISKACKEGRKRLGIPAPFTPEDWKELHG